MSEPLTMEEMAMVRQLQKSLRMVKRCRDCGYLRTLDRFAFYGSPVCGECEQRTWLDQQRQRGGRA